MMIALYRDTSLKYTVIRQKSEEPHLGKDTIRISEYVDVQFVQIPAAVEATKKAENYDEKRKLILTEYLALVPKGP